jgi:succinyl-diaminopimelate desuccinylase
VSDRVYRALRDSLVARRGEQRRFLAELVRVPSDNPPGDCAPHAARTAELLEGLGFAVERHPVPAELAAANGMISATNLVVRHRFGPGPAVALNAHGDVVPPGQGWSRDPYGGEIANGAMYGRGVAVSKSDFATYAFALLALIEQGPARGSVELHFTYDEEAGGAIGPKLLLDRGITKPDYVIAAGFSYNVVIAHDGCLHLEIAVKGKQAHAALPRTGHDALEATTRILAALYAHRRTLDSVHSRVAGIDTPTLVVGLIKGGINTNVVPDLVTMRLDRRFIPEENGEQVEQALRIVIEAAAAVYPGITVQIRRILLAEPLKPSPGQDKILVPLLRHAERVLGEKIAANGVPLYTDARHYAAAGIPIVLYGAGPRSILEAGAHAADEHLMLEDLDRATEIVAATVYDLNENGNTVASS